MMNRIFFAVVLATFALLLPARAQTGSAQKASATTPPPAVSSIEAERVIRAFATKESEFRRALNEYSFKRDATIQTIGMGGQITGEYRRVSRFVFDDSGNRYEKILLFPMPTISEIAVTPEDLEDLGGVQAFALEAPQLDMYNLTYVNKERIDELDLYVFDVTPKILSDPKAVKEALKAKRRYFQGRIWVDDRDLQIVKARGKGVPEDKNNKYPTFETYREHIDGRYWFPTYAYADDELIFGSGQVVRIRIKVRYSDFEKLRGKVRIIEEGEPGVDEMEDETVKPTAKPQEKKPDAPTMKP